MSLEEQVPEAETPEEPKEALSISPILATVLKSMPIPVDIVGHAESWQFVDYTEDDGTKSVIAAIAMTTGNGFDIYWYREQDLLGHIRRAMQIHQLLLRKISAMNPLIVANTAQMAAMVQQKKATDSRLILPGS